MAYSRGFRVGLVYARRFRRWMISEGKGGGVAGDSESSELSAINRATLAVFMARPTHSISTSLVFVKQNGPATKYIEDTFGLL